MQIEWYVTLDLQAHAYDEQQSTDIEDRSMLITLCGVHKMRWARTYIMPSDDARCFRCLVIERANDHTV